jgi:squalene-hopene/tetraprenyl-beta-curcumene cyclase
LRELVIPRALKILRRKQPESGGYLEAAPLTGFVTMSLAVAGRTDDPVARSGAAFLADTQRRDGSWPIDTNLATWVSTLSIKALDPDDLSPEQNQRLLQWLVQQQHTREHPFTHSPPGGWAWTNLSGGVPDADDTSGALLAAHKLLKSIDQPELRQPVHQAARDAVEWLLNLQNADGGMPTFCRGWGKLPFDRSCPDITAHAIRAWSAWAPELPADHRTRINRALTRALGYMRDSQRQNGSWVALWFGNQQTADQENPVFGTAQALISLASAPDERCHRPLQRGAAYLVQAQNHDGSWGAAAGTEPTLEETAQAISALCACLALDFCSNQEMLAARDKGAAWLLAELQNFDAESLPAAPIGLYFASLWYHEKLYPLIFVIEALRRLRESRSVEFGNVNP